MSVACGVCVCICVRSLATLDFKLPQSFTYAFPLNRHDSEDAEMRRREIYARNAVYKVWCEQKMAAFHSDMLSLQASRCGDGPDPAEDCDLNASTNIGFGV